MKNEKLNTVFISSWYPHKLKPLNGIFVKRHAMATCIDCNVSALFICSDASASIDESVEDGIYTIRGYYKSPTYSIPLLSPFIKLLRYLLLWRKIWMLYVANKGKPDIINSNIVFPVSIIAYILNLIYGIPYVITEHWTGYFPEDGRYQGFVKKIITKIAVSRAGAVITDSAKLGRTMLSRGLNNRYFTIPNVVDPEIFKIKSSYNKPDSYFNFIHVSSLDDEHKNITGMLKMFKKFRIKYPYAKFTIVWDEESIEMLEKIKEPFSEDAGVFLIGKKEGKELALLFQNANAFILFSNYENLPVVMLESFCCGVPVIGTRVGDVPEYINEKNGILIEPGNENQLLEAMEKMATNQANYNPAEIRKMVIEKVSPSQVSGQFTNLYKSVLYPNSAS